MSIPFSYLTTPDSLTFMTPEGKTYVYNKSNNSETFARAKELAKTISVLKDDPYMKNTVAAAIEQLVALISPATIISKCGGERVVVRNGTLYFDNKPVHSALADRIIWGLSEGCSIEPYVAFMMNIAENPSHNSVKQLFNFIEANKMGISEDGHVLGYKRVREDFYDIHSGTMDNSPGKIVEMQRNHVDDDAHRTCSSGLHFCSMSYLPHFGVGSGSKIVIVKVNPRDIVSVPVDYSNAKVRCCRYEVLGEYQGSDVEDILTRKPVWSSSFFVGLEEEQVEEDWSDDEDETDEDETDEDETDEPWCVDDWCDAWSDDDDDADEDEDVSSDTVTNENVETVTTERGAVFQYDPSTGIYRLVE